MEWYLKVKLNMNLCKVVLTSKADKNMIISANEFEEKSGING
jgi:hypothetical protein